MVDTFTKAQTGFQQFTQTLPPQIIPKTPTISEPVMGPPAPPPPTPKKPIGAEKFEEFVSELPPQTIPRPPPEVIMGPPSYYKTTPVSSTVVQPIGPDVNIPRYLQTVYMFADLRQLGREHRAKEILSNLNIPVVEPSYAAEFGYQPPSKPYQDIYTKYEYDFKTLRENLDLINIAERQIVTLGEQQTNLEEQLQSFKSMPSEKTFTITIDGKTKDYSYSEAVELYNKRINLLDREIEKRKLTMRDATYWEKEKNKLLQQLSDIKKQGSEATYIITTSEGEKELTYSKTIKFFESEISDIKEQIKERKNLTKEYFPTVREQKRLLEIVGTIEAYQTGGYKLQKTKEGVSFIEPKESEVVTYVYGPGRKDVYIAQTVRTGGLGTLFAGVQSYITGDKSIILEEQEKLAGGILGSTRKKGEDFWSYTGRVFTSPEMITGVYIPLATLGFGYGVSSFGRAFATTKWGITIGEKLGSGGWLSSFGKAFTKAGVQVTLIGGLYVATESPHLIETMATRPKRLASEFGSSIYRYSIIVGAGYAGAELGMESRLGERMLGGWQRTKDIFKESFPGAYGTAQKYYTGIQTFKEQNIVKDVFTGPPKYIPLPGGKGIMLEPSKEIISTTPEIEIIGEVKPEEIGVVGVKPYYPEVIETPELTIYKFKGGYKGAGYEGMFPKTEYTGYLITSKTGEPAVVRIFRPYGELGTMDVLVSRELGFNFGRATTEQIISGEIIEPTSKLSMLGIGEEGQISRVPIMKFRKYKTSSMVSEFGGYTGITRRTLLLPEKIGEVGIPGEVSYGFIKMEVLTRGKEAISVSGTTMTDIGYEAMISKTVKLPFRKPFTIMEKGSMAKYRFLGIVDETIPTKPLEEIILIEKGTIYSPYGKQMPGMEISKDFGIKPMIEGSRVFLTEQIEGVNIQLRQAVAGVSSGLKKLLTFNKTIPSITTKPVSIGATTGAIIKTTTKQYEISETKPTSVQTGKHVYYETPTIISGYWRTIRPTMKPETTLIPIIKTTNETRTDIDREIERLGWGEIYGGRRGQAREGEFNIIFEGKFGEIEITKNVQSLDRLLGKKLLLEQLSELELETIEIVEPIVIEPPPPPIPEEPRPVIPPPPLGEDELLEKKRKRKPLKEKGYDVFVKERSMYSGKVRKPTRFIKVNKKPLEIKSALALGGNVADNTSAISFKIKSTKNKPSPLTETIKPWSSIEHKFKKKGNTYIEQNPYRIDTPGEVKGISALGWIASRRKKIEKDLLSKKNSKKNILKKKGGKNVRYF